jgi:hypothetical protein
VIPVYVEEGTQEAVVPVPPSQLCTSLHPAPVDQPGIMWESRKPMVREQKDSKAPLFIKNRPRQRG